MNESALCGCSDVEGQKRVSDAQKLDLQMLGATMWVLGAELRFSTTAVSAPNRYAIPPAPVPLLLKNLRVPKPLTTLLANPVTDFLPSPVWSVSMEVCVLPHNPSTHASMLAFPPW